MHRVHHTHQTRVPDSVENLIHTTATHDTSLPVPTSAPNRTRLLIVDQHEVVRRGICALLQEQEDFEVVGQSGQVRDAVLQALQLHPDIVLLNVLPGTSDGLDIARQILRACPHIFVVMFTGTPDDEHLFRALRIGVHGYLQQSLPLAHFLDALRAISRGERVLNDPHALTQVLDEFGKMTREHDRLRRGLTDLDIELIGLAAEGLSNKEIAARQFWSEVTVKRRMQDIYRKLHVSDRAQAVAEAIRMGLL